MASASIENAINTDYSISDALYCPMIDARRMEVFTAIFNKSLDYIKPPSALILTEDSFQQELAAHAIIFSGNGHHKIKNILNHPHAFFVDVPFSASNMSMISENRFKEQKFADIAYSEPFYLKEFFSPEPKK
jgi:tRNA threonylcarbamoyladenosine biosynthesis protein TsaB